MDLSEFPRSSPAVPSDLPRIDPDAWPPSTRWPDALHRGLAGLARALDALHSEPSGPVRVLLGVSGGADSLALAVIAALAHRYKPLKKVDLRFSAVVVDHQLQPGSAEVAAQTSNVLAVLGIYEADIATVEVHSGGDGLEAAARDARYAAFIQTLTRLEQDHPQEHVAAVLTAHTASDQAEQVLLALGRGSGTRALAGIRPRRSLATWQVARPLLELSRADTEAICAWAGIHPWDDPMNTDETLQRVKVRKKLLPALADPVEGLGPGFVQGLVRTGQIAAEDADALEVWAEHEFTDLAQCSSDQVTIPVAKLLALPRAVQLRVIKYGVEHLGGPAPARERLLAVLELVSGNLSGTSAGPIEIEGHLVAHRRRRPEADAGQVTGTGPACVSLVLSKTRDGIEPDQ